MRPWLMRTFPADIMTFYVMKRHQGDEGAWITYEEGVGRGFHFSKLQHPRTTIVSWGFYSNPIFWSRFCWEMSGRFLELFNDEGNMLDRSDDAAYATITSAWIPWSGGQTYISFSCRHLYCCIIKDKKVFGWYILRERQQSFGLGKLFLASRITSKSYFITSNHFVILLDSDKSKVLPPPPSLFHIIHISV